MGFGLVIGFIQHLNTKLVTTFCYHYHMKTSVLSHGLHCAAW
jgi:hypothetical protein